jgi:hypothetical protein
LTIWISASVCSRKQKALEDVEFRIQLVIVQVSPSSLAPVKHQF